MADVPKLTDAEAAALRVSFAVDTPNLEHRGFLLHGWITDAGRVALAHYDAEQRAKIRIEAMRECIADAMAIIAMADADSEDHEEVFDLAQERANGARLVTLAIHARIDKEPTA